MKRSVLIHCNADLERGMGHLARSICVAEETLRRGWSVAIVGEFGGRAIEHARDLAPAIELIPCAAAELPRVLPQLLTLRHVELLHLDSYDVDLDEHLLGQVLLSNMQDGHFGRRAADLHIDANLDAESRYQRVHDGERMILGAAGMQIRRQMRSLRHEVRTTEAQPFRLLVVLGGTDPFDLTPALVSELTTVPGIHTTVISRPEQHQKLHAAVASRPERFHIIPFTKNLPELANSMDLVITAAGTSVWDFAAAGIPMALIAVTENQIAGYRACLARGLGLGLGEPPHSDLAQGVEALGQLLRHRAELERMSRLGREEIDGLGAWRVVATWEEMLAERAFPAARAFDASEFHARNATVEDARQLYEWRNDPATRTMSRSHDEVVWGDHLAWLRGTLANPDRKLCIVERRGAAIGTARWDRCGARAWEVSITVAPRYRGEGLAAAVLHAAERLLADAAPLQLFATVHDTNTASQRLFQRAGYLPHLPSDAAGFGLRAKWLLADEPRGS